MVGLSLFQHLRGLGTRHGGWGTAIGAPRPVNGNRGTAAAVHRVRELSGSSGEWQPIHGGSSFCIQTRNQKPPWNKELKLINTADIAHKN